MTECTHTHPLSLSLSQTDIWLNNKNTFQSTVVNNRILGYLDPSPAIGELPPVLVHVVNSPVQSQRIHFIAELMISS